MCESRVVYDVLLCVQNKALRGDEDERGQDKKNEAAQTAMKVGRGQRGERKR